jgi:hypothetical protein
MSLASGDTTSMGSYVLLWFQRNKGKDAIMKIWRAGERYFVKYTDPVIAPGKHAKFVFEDCYKLREYMDLFFENMIIDDEDREPFQYVQWDIPGFSCTLVKLDNMEDRHVFRTFASCLEFYFQHK